MTATTISTARGDRLPVPDAEPPVRDGSTRLHRARPIGDPTQSPAVACVAQRKGCDGLHVGSRRHHRR